MHIVDFLYGDYNYIKKMVANPKKMKKPRESVAKVSSTEEPKAGSLLRRSRISGISTPSVAPTSIFSTMALAMTKAILMEPEKIQANVPAMKLPPRPTHKVTKVSRFKRFRAFF